VSFKMVPFWDFFNKQYMKRCRFEQNVSFH
jgi:hypothetical protein